MRRHVIWLAGSAVASFALVWLFVVSCPFAFLDEAYVTSRVQKQALAACDLGEVAVFGDSRAEAAIIPALVSVPSTNLAQQATNPVETWFAVKQAMGCPKPPRLVVIAHSPHAVMGPAAFWTHDIVDAVLSFDERRAVERVAVMLGDGASLGPVPADGLPAYARDWAYATRFPPLFFASLADAGIGLRWFRNRGMRDYVRRSRGHYLFGEAGGSSDVALEAGMTEFVMPPLVDHYLTQTLEFLNERGVEVIFLTPPVNQATYDHIGSNVATDYLVYLRHRSQGLRHVHILADVIPCWPDQFFGDRAHFNDTGAEAYSRELNWLILDVLARGTIADLPNHCRRRDMGTRVSRSD